MTERTILVTGAAGFLGGHVLAALRSHVGRVVGMVRQDAQAAKVTTLGAEPVFADVTEPTSLVEAMAGVDAVIHLAAVSRDRDGLSMEMVNYRGTVNVLAAAKAARVSRLVQVVEIGADSRRAITFGRPDRRGKGVVDAEP